MSSYLPTIRFDTEYEADKVTILMEAMTRKAYVRILPAMEGAKDSTVQKMAVYDVACEVLGEHITEVTGLRDKNGNAVTKESLLNAVYFIDLVTEAFNKLVSECSLGKLKSTDSEAKSPESSAAPTSTISH